MAVGILISLRPPLPFRLFLAIPLITLEDGRILAYFVEYSTFFVNVNCFFAGITVVGITVVGITVGIAADVTIKLNSDL